MMSDRPIVMPMIRPPPREASVPIRESPPFVPGGTGFSVVMRIGGERERMPSSDARVSPRQHAKCLQNRFQLRFSKSECAARKVLGVG